MESKVMFVFPLNSCLGSYLVLPILLLDLISCIFRYSRQPTCSLAIFSLEFYFSLHIDLQPWFFKIMTLYPEENVVEYRDRERHQHSKNNRCAKYLRMAVILLGKHEWNNSLWKCCLNNGNM